MVTRSWILEWNETMKDIIMPWRFFTRGMRASGYRRKRVRYAAIAERVKRRIEHSIADPQRDPKRLKRDIGVFVRAQEGEAEYLQETIRDLIPEIAEARRRIAALEAEINKLSFIPELRGDLPELRRRVAEAKGKLHGTLTDAFLTINEQRMGRAR